MVSSGVIKGWLADLGNQIDNASEHQMYQQIVNGPFSNKTMAVPLGLGIVVLLLVNPETQTIDRIALSETEQADGAVAYSAKPFHEIKIPLKTETNILVQAIKTGQPQSTEDWQYLFTPDLTPEESRFNQAGAAIACSVVYPLATASGGAMIFSYFVPLRDLGQAHHQFMKNYAVLVSKQLSKTVSSV